MKVVGTVKIMAGDRVLYEGEPLHGVNLIQKYIGLVDFAHEALLRERDAWRAHRELGDPGSSE